MTGNAKLNFILIVVVVAIGIALYCWRTPSDVPIDGSTAASAATSGQPASTATAIPANLESMKLSVSTPLGRDADNMKTGQTGAGGGDPRQALRDSPESGVRDHLEAEASLLSPQVVGPDGTISSRMNPKAISAVMKSERFDEYMDALARQGADEQLAVDLTDLYSNTANDAAKEVGGVVVHRVVCGFKSCLAAVTSASRKTFDPWFQRFASTPPAQMRALVVHPHPLTDGTFEYRITFSTDSSSNNAEGLIAN